ncbi:hypothetical protein F5B22DRAFT_646491 [Xylaria bambusicola]|uniref:uncharacterized protein n=1 Tax=Xylaria bambusicola TaxID=326684 RepID=UPI002007427E|nr:uncharacterized protein F5B22DRAFT_646491 [Xylaria bambusicola]KAI0516753.1 hypothetical protein F5B22DRAFT_646491 [Xylaria bambusicola]
MSGPNTGTASIYEDGDEHNYSREAIRGEQRHHLQNVEGYMRKDQNRGMNDMLSEDTQAQINERYKTDPLYHATMHGNKPSRGAQQDAEIQAEEAEMLRKKQEKTDSMPGKKFEHKSSREH